MRLSTHTSADAPATDWPPANGFFRPPPRLTPDLARRFQADYYARIRPGLRLVSLLLAGLTVTQALVQSRGPAPPDLAVDVPVFLFWLCVFGLTWGRGFGRVWQPVLVLLGWATAAFVLVSLGHTLSGPPVGGGSPHPPPSGEGLLRPPSSVPMRFSFILQMSVLMVTLSTLRLQFRWAALLQGGVLTIGLWSFGTNLPPDADVLRDLHFILIPALVLLLALLLAAFTQEQLARGAFYASHLLAEERDDERRAREQTQGQLRVLAQAIGGIVHDLGNPLTVVQMGADLVEMQADSGDAAAIRETNGAVRDGAQMLGALRLSLIEQTRVLEGKPIPVNLWAEPLRPIVEAGARFQSPRFAGGRRISLVGEDLEIYADRPKLVTVFMNLIGNALKYGDGEVRVVWRTEGDAVLVGVLDQGTAGRGISEAQARRLFVAFGRLETHAAVEGTGLGLVSARKIVEAHGGEVFVEGHADGTPAAPPFTTAQGRYPSLLAPGFLTAFVVACPAQPAEAIEGGGTARETDERGARYRDRAEIR